MASLRLDLGLAYGAADGIEVPLHHDQLGDFHDGVDVGLLHETLDDADFAEVEGGLGGLIRNDAGVLVAREAGLFRDREEPQSASLVRSLRNGAVACDARCSPVRIELNRRAAYVEYWITGEGLELAFGCHAHAAITRVDGAGGRLNGEPRVAIDCDIVRGLFGPDHLAALCGRDKCHQGEAKAVGFARLCRK